MKEGLVTTQGLSKADLDEIHQLDDVCQAHDKIPVKLNWDMMSNRDAQETNDFFYYSDGKLLGYAPLDGWSSKFEITGLVLPEYRRKGIFRQLFEAAYTEARKRAATSLLLVSYRALPPGAAVCRALGSIYHNSEYHMEAKADQIPSLPEVNLQLSQVEQRDLPELARLITIAFGEGHGGDAAELAEELERPNCKYWLAIVDGKAIGQIGALEEVKGEVYIRAVGIVPEYRSKGYARQMLAAVIKQYVEQGYRNFSLDVVTENENALSLYQSCGFKQANVYDYFSVDVS